MESKTLKQIADEIREWRKEKGFYTPPSISPSRFTGITHGDAMLAKLMLVVTEISEAAEAVRHDNMENFIEELADATIRILDITAELGIDLEQAIEDKMKINRARAHRHGKQTTL